MTTPTRKGILKELKRMASENECMEDELTDMAHCHNMTLKDIENHVLTIVRDDGEYRHLQFRAPESGKRFPFDIITYPRHLVISSQAGYYLFADRNDLFQHFRGNYMVPDGHGGERINAQYWTEKLVASDTGVGHSTWDDIVFEMLAENAFVKWLPTIKATPERLTEIMKKFRDEVIDSNENGEEAALVALKGFSVDGVRPFVEFDWRSAYLPAVTYLCCCIATAWGVKQYDAAKAPAPQRKAARRHG